MWARLCARDVSASVRRVVHFGPLRIRVAVDRRAMETKKVQERPQVLGLQAHGPVGRDQFLERDDRFGIGGMAEYSRGYSW